MMGKIQTSPLNNEQLNQFESLTEALNPVQLAWISGYYSALLSTQNQSVAKAAPVETQAIQPSTTELTILYGSRTGNGEGLAKIAAEMASSMGMTAVLKNMETYKVRDLKNEKRMLVIVSTHGEGEPPFAAKELYDSLFGKRAPKLEGTQFAVLCLGDSSYLKFCQTGVEFDEQLEKLGGKRIHERVECDVDFKEAATNWIKDVLPKFSGTNQIANAAITTVEASNDSYSKSNPYKAELLERINLHGRGSERSTLHIELEAELDYQPGDSLGVFPVNAELLVQEVLKTTDLNAAEKVKVGEQEIALYDALRNHYELSNITIDVLKRYNEQLKSEDIAVLLSDKVKLEEFVYGRDIVDLLEEFPFKLDAATLIKVLRPIQPRLYSISSSAEATPGEVHLTVGVVDFDVNGRNKRGACSGYLEHISEDIANLSVFVEHNNNFRLPEQHQTPIIMVGAGTGIAPYRAFVQQRELADNPGKSWLFFGNRNFETEFLYQTEWQSFLKSGALTKMDVAFSRDNAEKVYVQHKLAENAAEVYQWLQEGAHFYICGDMKKMAGDVEAALQQIVETQGGLSAEQAAEYLVQLQREKRLQLDVY